ncbi:MAG: FkbM family methyltransferase, partial [Sphingobacteriaceae bacterium]|nr:FkbM family methyltransferase [Sphingobacteriaceae bacterium]
MKVKYSKLSLLKWSKFKALLSFGTKGYLADIGWIRSFDTGAPVDAEGLPLPWVTYSYIDFIKNRITTEHQIFEFGSGNSTLFYAERAKHVVSVEHNKEWFEKIKTASPKNSELIFCELVPNGAYSKMPITSQKKYDVIIIDGRDRVNCCKQALVA